MKQILNYSIQTIIKSYNYLAGPMSCIETSGIQYENFIIYNFCCISLRVLWNKLDFKMHNFSTWKCLSVQKISKRIVKSNVTKIICEEIIKKNYVYIMLNEYYIPNRDAYMNKNTRHDLTIVGFDDEKEEYDIIAYNSKTQLVHEKISYANVKLAFESYSQSFIKSLSMKKDYYGENENWHKIKKSLVKYNQFSKTWVYGCMVKNILLECQNIGMITLQSISIFEEHKKVLDIIANKLQINVFSEIKNFAEQIKLLILKYNITNNKNILLRVTAYFDQIRITEKKVIASIIIQINKKTRRTIWGR